MDFRRHHPQPVAAAKAGFSERTGRRIETEHRLPARQIADPRPRRLTVDPFAGLWDGEIRVPTQSSRGFGLKPATPERW